MADAKTVAPAGAGAARTHKARQYPAVNAAVGVMGAGLGAAAALGLSPIVIPAAVAGGIAGYFLTNKIPSE